MDRYDVVIIGAGLAGLALARQLLLNSEKKILLLEKRAEIPPAHQKVGEATVQVSGYYFSHPKSQYFVVGRLSREQEADYAQRKGVPVAQAERWLAANLDHDPE